MEGCDVESGVDEAVIGDNAVGDNAVIRVVPLTPAERRLWRELEARRLAALPLIRARSERFVTAGITVVFGIGSLSVNSLYDIELGWRIGFAVLMLLGLGFLFASTLCMLPAIEVERILDTVEALAKDQTGWIEALNKSKTSWIVREELKLLKLSRRWTLASFLLITFASVISWFAPRK